MFEIPPTPQEIATGLEPAVIAVLRKYGVQPHDGAALLRCPSQRRPLGDFELRAVRALQAEARTAGRPEAVYLELLALEIGIALDGETLDRQKLAEELKARIGDRPRIDARLLQTGISLAACTPTSGESGREVQFRRGWAIAQELVTAGVRPV